MRTFQRHHIARICAALLAALSTLCWAGEPELDDEPLARLKTLSIEELMNLEVTSVSKKEEKFSEAAAALYVITQEDLRRSGATSIAEALRMVPGLQVAQIDANKWAISSRGFNDVFANKLLVLMDGRSVYTPMFSGVYWEVQDTLLEDIERIEVIRGPGATLWGANAVNGVINIITKSAHDTQGWLVTSGAGTHESLFGAIRYGGKLSDDASYRIYTNYFDRDSFARADGSDAADDWDVLRGGFRIDWETSVSDSLTFQGDIYQGDISQTLTSPSLFPPFSQTHDDAADLAGGNVLARWQHTVSDASDMALQLYYDHAERRQLTHAERRDTFDVDFQHRFPLASRHELVWGLGYRLTTDDTDNGIGVSFDPESREDHLYSAFIQDKINIIDDRFWITLGSKFEHNDYTGFEVQPGARLLWTPKERQAVWASVSRAVQTPSRCHSDFRTDAAVFPNPDGSLNLLAVLGNEDAESEELLAYELGYRVQPSERLALDIAAFFNEYDNLRTFEPGRPFPETSPAPPHLVLPSYVDNRMDGETYGVEIAAHCNVTDHWKLAAGYAYLQIELHPDASSRDRTATDAENNNPHHQFHVRSYLDLLRNLQFDTALYYVEALDFLRAGLTADIPRCIRLDARLAWRATRNLDVSLVVQNALDDRHLEFGPSSGINPTEVERSIYAKVTWRF